MIKAQIASFKAVAGGAETENSSLKGKIDDVLRLAKRSQAWTDPKKQRRLEKLLAELKTLLAEQE